MPADPQAERALFEGLFWLGALVLAALVGGVFLIFVKRRSQRAEGGAAQGFALADLRRLRDRGELSIEEYEMLKQRAIEDLGRSAEPKD